MRHFGSHITVASLIQRVPVAVRGVSIAHVRPVTLPVLPIRLRRSIHKYLVQKSRAY